MTEKPDELTPQDAPRAPVPPVSATAVVYDGDRAFNLAALRRALPEKEQLYFDDMRGRFRASARNRTKDINAKAPRVAPRLRYSKDVADAEAWRTYHHQRPRSAERVLAATKPVGAAPPRAVEKQAPAQTPATSPATDLAKSDPDLVRTRDGDSIRFSDLRAYVQPIDARSRPLDDIRESAERRGQDPAPQQIWSRYEERDPAAASRAAEGVKQIQQHIDTGRYPEATPAEVTQSRFIDTAAYYLEKQRGEAPSRSEVVQDLREHYRGWAKSESAWRGYDERHGIEHTSHDHARGGEPRAIDAHAQAIETTRQPNDLTPSR